MNPSSDIVTLKDSQFGPDRHPNALTVQGVVITAVLELVVDAAADSDPAIG